jgi:hypothetical protein
MGPPPAFMGPIYKKSPIQVDGFEKEPLLLSEHKQTVLCANEHSFLPEHQS